MYRCFACTNVWVSCALLVPVEARKGCWSCWDGSDGLDCCELQSHARNRTWVLWKGSTVSALNC